jgi:4-hydroxythreonine-4-phosphate dehydrogenase
MQQLTIGVSCGDVNGIGLEVILKSLALKKAAPQHKIVLYAGMKVVSYHKNIITQENVQFSTINSPAEAVPGQLSLVNCWQDNVNISIGKISDVGGQCAMQSLERATADLKAGLIDVLVTAPIHKKAMDMAGFGHIGHTEYLTQAFAVKDSLMMLVSNTLRIGLVTNHLPIQEVAGRITKETVLKKINIMHESLRVDFGIDRPLIAVLGLNPHAGDDGTIGQEELKHIRPAVEAAKETGKLVFGPFSADGFFGSGTYQKYDGILAMYHDQGLVAFKALSFGSGVNYTAGLPVIRTSPDHGTAMEIAGQNKADETSFIHALYLAIDLFSNRLNYFDMRADSIERRKQKNLPVENGPDEEHLEFIPED